VRIAHKAYDRERASIGCGMNQTAKQARARAGMIGFAELRVERPLSRLDFFLTVTFFFAPKKSSFGRRSEGRA
jgi:hypothetical protein